MSLLMAYQILENLSEVFSKANSGVVACANVWMESVVVENIKMASRRDSRIDSLANL